MTDSSTDEPTLTSTTHSPPSTPSLKALPRPISIRHSQSYDPSPPSTSRRSGTNRKSLTTSRSAASLSMLSSPTSPTPGPSHPHLANGNAPNSASDASHEYELRSQVSPLRTSPFSNPFRKLQNTFGGSKKSLDLGNSNNNTNNNNNNNNSQPPRPEKVVSSSSSANSLNSWRSKGAEILSKLGPLLSNSPGPMSSQPIFGANLERPSGSPISPTRPWFPLSLHRCAQFLEAKASTK
ncbi:MAG: hypothetical protein J3R72DRAFT_498876 [Linnemannia gamsii]|nr:MAG: hypothetical protein J3R72DRAFT_498876 [Linnemannia gamsii]